MPFVPALILWSMSLLLPWGMDGPRTPRPELETTAQRAESCIGSPITLSQAQAPGADVPSVAEVATTQAEDDDSGEGDALHLSPLSRPIVSSRAEASAPLPSSGDRAHACGRSLPIRC